jgi:hypothetical protein
MQSTQVSRIKPILYVHTRQVHICTSRVSLRPTLGYQQLLLSTRVAGPH